MKDDATFREFVAEARRGYRMMQSAADVIGRDPELWITRASEILSEGGNAPSDAAAVAVCLLMVCDSKSEGSAADEND